MKILPIISNNIINQNNKPGERVPSNLSFSHHPDFDRLIKDFPLCASAYFRRGSVVPGASPDFIDIVRVFNNVFKTDGIKKLLIIGIANSEEPLSYLSTIKQIKKDKPVDMFLDLHILDLQSKPDKEKVFIDSYLVYEDLPDYAKDSFIYDPEHSEWSFHKYRVADDIFRFLNYTYSNNKKSKWETRVQEGITEYPENCFDIISVNNVLFYLDTKEIDPTVENIYRALKLRGYMITEDDIYIQNNKIYDRFVRVANGIFKKIK